MGGDSLNRSNQQKNNDFYLYYHNGSNTSLSISYTGMGNALDLDLILYYDSYVYFEDDKWYAGQSSSSIARQSRTAGSSESISLNGLPAGFYVLNVKINAYQKTSGKHERHVDVQSL